MTVLAELAQARVVDELDECRDVRGDEESGEHDTRRDRHGPEASRPGGQGEEPRDDERDDRPPPEVPVLGDRARADAGDRDADAAGDRRGDEGRADGLAGPQGDADADRERDDSPDDPRPGDRHAVEAEHPFVPRGEEVERQQGQDDRPDGFGGCAQRPPRHPYAKRGERSGDAHQHESAADQAEVTPGSGDEDEPGDDEAEGAERQQDRADRPTAFLGGRLLSHARVRRQRAVRRLSSRRRRDVRRRCRRWLWLGHLRRLVLRHLRRRLLSRRSCERVRAGRRRRRQHRAIPRERRPRQQLVSLQKRLPELPDLGRRQVEAAVRTRRLTGDCAATVRTGLRVCEAHGITVS